MNNVEFCGIHHRDVDVLSVATGTPAPTAEKGRRGGPLTHAHLGSIVPLLPADYAPYGTADRDAASEQGAADCSSGCRWWLPIKGALGKDWGVCCSERSHRCGLLTFEHQGCSCFEPEGVGPC